MANSQYTSAERHLQRSMRYNLEKGILPSENKIIARMLDRPKDMRPVYEDFSVNEIVLPDQGRTLDALVSWLSVIDSREFRQIPEAITESPTARRAGSLRKAPRGAVPWKQLLQPKRFLALIFGLLITNISTDRLLV